MRELPLPNMWLSTPVDMASLYHVTTIRVRPWSPEEIDA